MMNRRPIGAVGRIVRSFTVVSIALASAAGLAACGSDDETPATVVTTTIPPGIANPASEYCVAQGGTLDIVTEPGGQVGYCNLPDGTRVEEWEYFRSQTGATNTP